MRKTTLHTSSDILSQERGTAQKPWENHIRIALVYPNTYYVGMSNLGFQTVYTQLNEIDSVVCERFFLPDDVGPPEMLRSIESQRRLTEFDVIAFSISFENDYSHILNILALANIPLFAKDRIDSFPLVVAGGVATFLNPEPIADFIDIFFIGEAEMMIGEFLKHFDPNKEKTQILEELAQKNKGVYVPSFYDPIFAENGKLTGYRKRKKELPDKIERQIASFEQMRCATTTVFTPNTLFANTFLMEVGKGCPHGCRFCSAGFVYRPPRFHSLETLREKITHGSIAANHIGLVGAAVSDHPHIPLLLENSPEEIRISFSSLRADNLQPLFIQTLMKSHIKSVAIAPDAGSERLRRVINKGISEEDLLAATEKLVNAGIPNVKLYFMIGLPTETQEDIKAIVELTQKIKERFLEASRLRGKMGEIVVTVSSFVPKPWTPFQWCAMDSETSLKQKLKYLRQKIKSISNVKLYADSVPSSILQGILARGNRKTSSVLLALHQKRPLTSVLKSYSAEKKEIISEFQEDTFFPWDILSGGVSKKFLWKEYQLALIAKSSPICPMNDICKQCGACK